MISIKIHMIQILSGNGHNLFSERKTTTAELQLTRSIVILRNRHDNR